ncbi:MAG: glycosyltransferase [Cytophagales bacterium]|nr:glycosyltransferase [Cytophagales bacterium]
MTSIALLSTAVSPLGLGKGGGVEKDIIKFADLLTDRHWDVDIYCPEGSKANTKGRLIPCKGKLEAPAQYPDSRRHLLPTNSFLFHALKTLAIHRNLYSLIINFSYDWLPFYQSFFFEIPVLHYLSICSHTKEMDEIIKTVSETFHNSVAVLNQEQAETYQGLSLENICRLGYGIKLDDYPFSSEHEEFVAWAGRIAPEKGLEDALEFSERSGTRLKIFGYIQDETYWRELQKRFAAAPFSYEGFLPSDQLPHAFQKAKALLFTTKKSEALGIVILEAMACGVPVIAYDNPGPRHILSKGPAGFLVTDKNAASLINVYQNIGQVKRETCRRLVEEHFAQSGWENKSIAWVHGQLHPDKLPEPMVW